MAAFGISFPKLTFSRSATSKADTNTVSTTTTPSPPSVNTRTLSLSIKNVPSQPLHYDVSTTTITVPKKKPTSIATILAIDGETKQLPKNLSVFNELQLDDGKINKHSLFCAIKTQGNYPCTCLEAGDINEKIRRQENSSDVIVSSSLSPMGTIDHRPDIRFLANVDSKNILYDSQQEEKILIPQRRSSHTFTPPTTSLSHNSSTNDLHFTSSGISVDLPQLKYAIEKFLVDEDEPIYQVAEEFPPGSYLFHSDHNGNTNNSNVSKSDLKQQHDDINQTERHQIPETNTNDETSSRSPTMSNTMKWYVSELRINRPLIYRTQWTIKPQNSCQRKFSHSISDLKHIYNIINRQELDRNRTKPRKANNTTYSTLSLHNLNNQQQQYGYQSDDNILFDNHLSCTDDNLNNLPSDDDDDDDQHLLPLTVQRTLDRSIRGDDTLIRNESVKKKLFDILNDDELENACLEDMSQEFEQMSISNPHRNLQTLNSFSSSSDDALYSSPPNELQLPLPPPPLSSSYNENLSANINNTTERFFGRSRLITTSLDKIPMNNNNNNNNAYDYPSSPCLLRPSYENTRPSWYTSPSPQWRMDDHSSLASVLKRHSSKNEDHLNDIDPNRLLSTKVTEYDIKENKYIQKYNHHHHQKEQKRISYSLMNTSTPLVDNSTPILPIIQDKSSSLLMFI